MTTNRHHRRPKAHGGNSSKRNMVRVPVKKHQAWHLLFGVENPTEIARIINDTWLDPRWELIAKRRE